MPNGRHTTTFDSSTRKPSFHPNRVNCHELSQTYTRTAVHLTALALSFNNLRTKKARTILVAFAGSIGIIGIALILSLSNGVNEYINRTEQQTLSQYPLTIERSSISFMSMMMVQTETWEPAAEGEITEVPSVGQLLSTVQTNDLISLREYFDTERPEIYELSNGVEYSYSIDPRIYYYDKGTGDYRQVNPNVNCTVHGILQARILD